MLTRKLTFSFFTLSYLLLVLHSFLKIHPRFQFICILKMQFQEQRYKVEVQLQSSFFFKLPIIEWRVLLWMAVTLLQRYWMIAQCRQEIAKRNATTWCAPENSIQFLEEIVQKTDDCTLLTHISNLPCPIFAKKKKKKKKYYASPIQKDSRNLIRNNVTLTI